MKTLKEINDELKKISEEYSKLFEKEQKLKEEKKELLAKDILDNKTLNRYKWKVEKRNVGFSLKPVYGSIFDDIQTKLDLYPHGSFQLNEKIELYGDDGDLYIVSSDIKAGIEFIKSQSINIIIGEDIINNIESMEKQLTGFKEFVDQFDIMKEKKCEEKCGDISHEHN